MDSLVEALRQLRTTANFFKGVGESVGPCRNVICFSRLKGRDLGLGRQSASKHHRHVCIVSLGGEGAVWIDAWKVRLRPGEMVVVQPYQYHSYAEVDEHLNWLFITFEGEGWEALANAAYPVGGMELQLCGEIMRCWSERQWHRLISAHLSLLLERIRLGVSRQPPEEEEGQPDLLVQVNRYVLDRLDRVVSLPELAQALGVSESHLRARFRQMTGHPLGGHLRALRLNRACALLHATKDPVTQIAEACGFESVYSFSRAFKAAYLISPRDYRNSVQ